MMGYGLHLHIIIPETPVRELLRCEIDVALFEEVGRFD